MWRHLRRRGRVRRRRGGRGSQRGAPRAAAASRSCSQSSPSCAHTHKGLVRGGGSSEAREGRREGRTDAPGVRRKKARRSPSLMSRRTLQPSHASRRIGGGGGSIGVGEERELGRKRSDDKQGFKERAGRVGSGRVGSHPDTTIELLLASGRSSTRNT